MGRDKKLTVTLDIVDGCIERDEIDKDLMEAFCHLYSPCLQKIDNFLPLLLEARGKAKKAWYGGYDYEGEYDLTGISSSIITYYRVEKTNDYGQIRYGAETQSFPFTALFDDSYLDSERERIKIEKEEREKRDLELKLQKEKIEKEMKERVEEKLREGRYQKFLELRKEFDPILD